MTANNRRGITDNRSGFTSGAERGPDPQGPAVIYPSVYVSDAPREYTDASFRDLHDACGVPQTGIVSMKFLPAKTRDAETCSVIVRYIDDESASQAVGLLQNTNVQC